VVRVGVVDDDKSVVRFVEYFNFDGRILGIIFVDVQLERLSYVIGVYGDVDVFLVFGT